MKKYKRIIAKTLIMFLIFATIQTNNVYAMDTLGSVDIHTANSNENGYVYLEWHGYADADHYRIFVNGNQWGGDYGGTSINVTGLANGTTYRFQVLAYDYWLWSWWHTELDRAESLYATPQAPITTYFDAMGGNSVPPISNKYNTPVTRPGNPSKLGYTFADWYTESTCINKWNFNTNVTSSRWLYAKWNPIPISFDKSSLDSGVFEEFFTDYISTTDGSEDINYYLEDGSSLPDGITLSEDGTIEGTSSEFGVYTFIAKAVDMNNDEFATAEITLNIELAGPVSDPQTDTPSGGVEYHDSIMLTTSDGADVYYTIDDTVPTVDSILFSGDIIIDKETSIKAIGIRHGWADSGITNYNYTINKHRVTYNVSTADSGDAPVDATEYKRYDTVEILDIVDVEKLGYDFDGWDDDSGSTFYAGDIATMDNCASQAKL